MSALGRLGELHPRVTVGRVGRRTRRASRRSVPPRADTQSISAGSGHPPPICKPVRRLAASPRAREPPGVRRAGPGRPRPPPFKGGPLPGPSRGQLSQEDRRDVHLVRVPALLNLPVGRAFALVAGSGLALSHAGSATSIADNLTDARPLPVTVKGTMRRAKVTEDPSQVGPHLTRNHVVGFGCSVVPANMALVAPQLEHLDAGSSETAMREGVGSHPPRETRPESSA